MSEGALGRELDPRECLHWVVSELEPLCCSTATHLAQLQADDVDIGSRVDPIQYAGQTLCGFGFSRTGPTSQSDSGFITLDQMIGLVQIKKI